MLVMMCRRRIGSLLPLKEMVRSYIHWAIICLPEVLVSTNLEHASLGIQDGCGSGKEHCSGCSLEY